MSTKSRQGHIEALFVRPDRIDIFDDAEFLIPSLHNWRQWGPAARPVFESEVRPFVMLRVANRSEYPKHYPPHGMIIDDIRSASRSRDSLLYPNTTAELQLELLREVIASELREFLGVTHTIIHIRAPSVVGAALGDDTRYLAYDISFSASLAHAYPIPAKEFPKRRCYDSWLPPSN